MTDLTLISALCCERAGDDEFTDMWDRVAELCGGTETSFVKNERGTFMVCYGYGHRLPFAIVERYEGKEAIWMRPRAEREMLR